MNRTILIQAIIDHFGYTSYLEIGCENNFNYDKINIKDKIGVDPKMGGTHRMTSDEFFEQNKQTFDIIFIDGLHLWEQVDKDIINSLNCLNNNGTIVMHDCCPTQEKEQLREQDMIIRAWTGDVWKSFVKLRCLSYLDCAVGNFNNGCGVVKVRNNSDKILVDESLLTWDNLSANKQKWLRLMPFEEIVKFAK